MKATERHKLKENELAHSLGAARDFVAPTLQRRKPEGHEVDALKDLDAELAKLSPDTPGDEIQNVVFEVGKRHPFESLRHWFQALYETLLGSSQGPRMGTASASSMLGSPAARRGAKTEAVSAAIAFCPARGSDPSPVSSPSFASASAGGIEIVRG